MLELENINFKNINESTNEDLMTHNEEDKEVADALKI
jgi:hypothetical protein